MNNIPEMSVEEFEHPFLIDLRKIEFIPDLMCFWNNPNLTLQEIRLLNFVDFKEWKSKGVGCKISDSDLAMVVRTSEKRLRNIMGSLIRRGYLRKENNGLRELFAIRKEN